MELGVARVGSKEKLDFTSRSNEMEGTIKSQGGGVSTQTFAKAHAVVTANSARMALTNMLVTSGRKDKFGNKRAGFNNRFGGPDPFLAFGETMSGKTTNLEDIIDNRTEFCSEAKPNCIVMLNLTLHLRANTRYEVFFSGQYVDFRCCFPR